MPRDARTNFSGGVNTAVALENLRANEVRAAVNMRASVVPGALKQRGGTQRIHGTVLESGAAILGGFHYKFGGTSQIVVIANGKLHHKTPAAANFTTVTPGTPFSTTVRPSFATFTSGGDTKLYIADGRLWEWDGTTLTLLNASSEPDARYLEVYKSRLFVTEANRFLYWSSVADPTDFSSTPPSTGGLAQVDTFLDDPLVALATSGSSLILLHENAISRFTGTSRENIQVDTESQGISRDHGVIAPRTVAKFGPYVFFLSDSGPRVATEGSEADLGTPLNPEWDGDKTYWPNAVAVYNKGHQELLLAIPTGTSSENNRIWCYSVETQSWTGPWESKSGEAFRGFNACSLWSYEDTDGTETFMVGGYDGWVRQGDVGTLDDALSDGTGGSPVPARVDMEFAFGDPASAKILHGPQELSLDLGASGKAEVTTSGDLCSTQTTRITTRGAGVDQYRFRNAWRGRRLNLSIAEDTGAQLEFTGAIFDFQVGRRAV